MQFTPKSTQELLATACDCLVVPVYASAKLGKTGKKLDQLSKGALGRILRMDDIEGKPGQALLVHQPEGIKARRLLLLGCGEKDACTVKDFHKAVDSLLATVAKTSIRNVGLLTEDVTVADHDSNWLLRQLAQRCITSAYRYTTTRGKAKKDDKAGLKKLLVSSAANKASAQRALKEGKAIGTGMNAARQLGNLPGNICTPSYLASQARALARKHAKLTTKVLNEKQMAALGMGALLSVSAGTRQPARFIIMEYRGTTRNSQPQVLVGKGITFDSGGISLKPGAAMDEMKFDMCGAASVIGAMTTLTELSLPINVIGIVASAENMPGGSATKPGDVVTSMSGKTIEILNTDAEGRLVLCDALTYAERYKPSAVIDVATLTGACIIALGHTATGLFSNNEELANKLLSAGETVHDRAWQLPIWDDYKAQLDSNFADLANIGGRGAGSITAAVFLSQFAEKYPWAHLDIAGTAWNSGKEKGATGRPVALLGQYLLDCSKRKAG
jgi:leucyl aminopeptidase